mgnify:CR=1 FL=1
MGRKGGAWAIMAKWGQRVSLNVRQKEVQFMYRGRFVGRIGGEGGRGKGGKLHMEA